MIIVANRIPVAEGWEERFLDRFRNRAGLIDDSPGFLRNMVLAPRKHPHQDEDAPLYHVVLTFWESEEAFWEWTRSESFEEAHSNLPPPEMFAGESALEMHEVMLDTRSEPGNGD